MLTESRNQQSANIHQQSALDIVQTMNAEDATVAHAVQAVLPQIAAAVDMIVTGINAGGRLVYIGAGTSGRLAVLDAAECVPTFSVSPDLVLARIAGGEAAMLQAVEGAEDDSAAGAADLQALNLSAVDVVVGIAASGRTPYVIGALTYANSLGAGTIAISCNHPAPILDIATIKIAALVGPEVITGSTRLKAGSAQKMILNMLSTASMIRLGKVYGNLMVDVKVSNEKLADRASRIVQTVADVSAEDATQLLAQSGQQVKVAIVMGRLGLDAAEAESRLAAVDGHLAALIDTE